MTKIKLSNFGDLERARCGDIPAEAVRSAEIPALVDTGATTLVLPADVVERLGLRVVEIKKIRLADGTLVDSPRVSGVRLEILGRDMVTSAYVLPAGTRALIGQIPLEELDLVVDPHNQDLRPNPEHPDGPIHEVLSAAA